MSQPIATALLLCCLLIVGCQSASTVRAHPVPESDLWLTYPAGDGPGQGRHIVLIAAEQEYRSEQALPMLARTLSQVHGFNCTVLFLVNEDGLVDPTMDNDDANNVPGLEYLDSADCVIWMSRFLHLSDPDVQHFYDYFDSGKPIIALRTANHGLRGVSPYLVNGQRVTLDQMLGGSFRGHHGGWKREATSGIVVPENASHPVLTGVQDVWGTTDVYRCQEEDHVREGSTALLMGQPMRSHERDAPANTDKVALPILWTTSFTGNRGLESRILHFTMGSAEDFANAGVRRVVINGVYWGLGMEDTITPDLNVDIIGDYEPMVDGFNYADLGVHPRPASDYR